MHPATRAKNETLVFLQDRTYKIPLYTHVTMRM